MKRTLATALFAAVFLFNAYGIENAEAYAPAEAGFESLDGLSTGNELQSVDLSGRVHVVCTEGGTRFATYSCYGNYLSPAEYAYFVTSPGGSADEVRLTATHEDGSTRVKKSGFNPSTGKSKSRINLWIATLFQRPLLEAGVNQVKFELLKAGVVEREGQFTVNVGTGQSVRCRDGHITSPREEDCRVGHNACDEYFFRTNSCR